jgi:hypothetical protein
MYDRFSEVWDGLSRHAFAGSNYKPFRMCLAVLGIYLLNVVPFFIGFFSVISAKWDIAILCTLPVSVMIGTQIFANRQFNVPFYYFLSFPVATALYGLMMLNSMISYYFRGGNLWKGRRYRKTVIH